MTDDRHINSPFGYFGSKNKIAAEICAFLPPHNAWVEAFCGSAAITLAKPPAPLEIINDLDKQIINFFEQVRNNTDELCRIVALTPYAREELRLARQHESVESLSGLEQARRFLILSMMAINGAFGAKRGGFSYSQSYVRAGREARVNRWYNLPQRIEEVVERLRSVRVENLDARHLLKSFVKRPATLVYMDPPYFCKRANGYNIDAKSESFHSDLLKLSKQAKCMILLSGYDSNLYNEMLRRKDGWKKVRINTFTRGVSGKDFSRTEFVWMNKGFQTASKKGCIPIHLSPKEILEKKVNPLRN